MRDGFGRLRIEIDLLGDRNTLNHLHDLVAGQRSESEDGASRLDRFDDLRGIIAGQDEATGRGVLLHDAPQRALCIRRQRVGLVEENHLERGPRHGRGLGETLDFGSNGFELALVTRVHLEEIHAVTLTEDIASEGQSRSRLSSTRWPSEEEVWECARFGVSLEPVDHRFLAFDVGHRLRSMAFNPHLTHGTPSASRVGRP